MAPKIKNRHASDGKVKTPLTELTEAMGMNASKLGRRAAVVAASGGLLVGLGLPATAGNEAAVKTDEATTDAPQYTANGAVTTSKVEGKQEAVSVAGAEGIEASAAPKETAAPARDARKSGASRGSSEGAVGEKESKDSDSKGSKDKAAGDYPDAPSGSVVDIAMQYDGVPYKWGGTTPKGWDCSGFVGYVYKQAGKKIPRTSAEQRSRGTQISKAEAKPGDLVYAATPRSHIGIYLGGDKMIDAGNERVDTSVRSFKWMGKVSFVRY